MPDDILNPATAPVVTDPGAVALKPGDAGYVAPAADLKPGDAGYVAPVAAPIADPVVPAAGVVDDKTGVITYEPTGDVALDLSLEFFGKLGLALDSPELAEAGKGNFQYLEAKLAALGDKAKGYEKYIALAKEAHTRLDAGQKAATDARRKTVHDAVGGEETWKGITDHVHANATPEEKEEVRKALMQGGIVAQAMAKLLHSNYLAATGTVAEPQAAVKGQETAPKGTPLTLTGYKQELNTLVAKIGSANVEGHPEYTALRRKYAHAK